jgi:aminopeptidase
VARRGQQRPADQAHHHGRGQLLSGRVPFDSPINQTGLLFYNTLFDENACCHLALGMGFADTIRDFQNKTLEECRALGVNDSMIHEDFMIGSADLSIDAVCDGGKVVPIFRNGTWAF